MRRPLPVLVAFATSLITAACGQPERADVAIAPRTIVLVTIDTLRADRLGAYGSTRGLTPRLDSFAHESVRFDAAIAQVPLTLPSHATILTGLRPPAHGVRTNDGFRLPENVPTLPEALKQVGYRTGAFIGAFPLRRAGGLSRGFDRYDDDFLRGGSPREERLAEEVVTAAAAWIRTQRDHRLFAWIHLFDPHTPYAAPPEHAARHPQDPYEAEVEYTDAAVGRLLDTLRELGVYESAFVVVTADHGEGLGEHGERTHGTFVYDPTIRVPLLVRVPGAGPRTVAAPAETADIAPTIAAAAGVPLGAVDGIDLGPVLRGAAGDPERATYAESYYQHVLVGWSPLRTVRTSRWKFIEAPRPELYDLLDDPHETTNVVDHRSPLAAGLAAALPTPVPPGGRAAAPAPTGAARAEAAERLRSLGYFSGRTSGATAAGVPDPKDRIEVWNHLERGVDASTGDPAAARRAFAQALALDPRNGLALKYLGDLSYRAGDHRSAAEQYRAAIATGFSHADVFINLGAVASQLGRADEARQAFERAVAVDPGAADAWNQLGTVHAGAGRIAVAREAFERVLTLEPASAEARYNLALIARAERRERDAMRLLGEAVSHRPDYPEAHFERGNGYLTAGRPAEALESFRAALAARPAYPEALFNAARAAAALGRLAEARRDYQHFLDLAPTAYREHRAAARRELARLSSPRTASGRRQPPD